MTAGLEINGLVTGYGELRVIRGLDLRCEAGQITALLGRNGAGKTTTLSAVAGLLPTMSGTVRIFGEEQTGRAAKRVRAGLSLVQEGKRVFRKRTVEENLRLGGFVLGAQRAKLVAGIEQAFERFPILKEKRRHPAGTLSGGQQQMLGIAQALMSDPRVLMLDEPSAGLAPSIVEEVFGEIANLKNQGLCVLLVEQLVDNSLSIADHVAVLDHGRITIDTPVAELGSWDTLRSSYLGEDVSEAVAALPQYAKEIK